jgi:anti-anti-sigma regulatory factor
MKQWLENLPISDPLERRQALLLQVMLLVLLAACLIGLPLGLLTAPPGASPLLPLTIYPLLFLDVCAALWMLRRGSFNWAVGLATIGPVVAIGIALIATGFTNSEVILLAFAAPIAMAGLLLGRRGLALAAGLSIAFVLLTGLLQAYAPGMVGFLPNPPATSLSITVTCILVIAVLCLFLDQFGTSLRQALTTTRAREQELEELRTSLETTVEERTASLQQALRDVEQREASLAQALSDLGDTQAVVRELSAPVIPVLPGVLVAPLVGALDSRRAAVLTEQVLGSVEHERARYVIFDITGVPLVDTQVAQVLIQTTMAVRLLGAQALLVGMRPEVAQTIVGLGVDLSAIRTFPNLQEAVAALLERQGGARVR